MAREHSSPTAMPYDPSPQQMPSLLNAQASVGRQLSSDWISVSTPEKECNFRKLTPIITQQESFGKAPQAIPVTEFDPGHYLSVDDRCPPAKTNPAASSLNTLSDQSSPIQRSLYPPASSPLSCSSGTSLNTWTCPTSPGMSRQDSLGNGSFCNDLNMMRINSKASNRMPFLENEEADFPSPRQRRTMSGRFDRGLDLIHDAQHSLCHTGGAVESNNLPLNPIVTGSMFAPDEEIDLCMQRTVSTQSQEFGAIVNSPDSDDAPTRCRRTSSASRPIEPKPLTGPAMSREPSLGNGYEMVKLPSSDGSVRNVVKIQKASQYIRPAHEKVKCIYPGCIEQPDGYKGDHEMKRHYDRAHKEIRSVYMCVNRSDNPTFLSKCKSCNAGKQYNADYNAGEHLRRLHFNPKPPKTRRGHIPEEEKRGGKGGGNWPDMDELRKYMIAFEVNQNQERVSEPRKVNESSNLIMPTLDELESRVPSAGPTSLHCTAIPSHTDDGILHSGGQAPTESASPTLHGSLPSPTPHAMHCQDTFQPANPVTICDDSEASRNFDPNNPHITLFEEYLSTQDFNTHEQPLCDGFGELFPPYQPQ